ncbi:unnamed protein product [Arabis nemorensis]|uniref:Uncharacterized protein n=1 Tax=Arabis nemorensis TaxID=586526 RepID=A0A565CLL5_9BRAS|nr:unnamed protein product [Arabis nemorensis]
MVTLSDILSDLVRVEQGWRRKNVDGVWKFVRLEERLSKGIKILEGEGVEAVRSKVMKELRINDKEEHIELTYEMP